MRIIEVKPFNPAPGSEYHFSSYPGPGLYLSSDGAMRLVNAGIVILFPGVADLIMDVAPVAAGLSESFVLKALAIAHSPQLAAELTK